VFRVGATAPRLGPPDARPDDKGSFSRASDEVDRRVAQGRSPLAAADLPPVSPIVAVGTGLLLVAIALVIYSVTHPVRFYDHFEWQALAFLEGHAAIRYPVGSTADCSGNACFNDVMTVPTDDGVPRGLIPFPPLPAVLLVPFVALWGRATDGQLVFAVLGAIDVGLAWWVLGRLPIRQWVRVATLVFFAFGTVFWYAAQLGTTWYQAHVLAIALVLLAIGLSLGGDRLAVVDEDDLPDAGSEVVEPDIAERASARRRPPPWFIPDRRQFLAGFLLGLACTARLTVIFAAPFFVLVGPGGSWLRRGWSAALGAGIPIAALLVYNLVATGDLFNPAYEALYRIEAFGYPQFGYQPDWSIEDVRYVARNLETMFLSTPVLDPVTVPRILGGEPLCVATQTRGLFSSACPLLLPRDTGMSVLLTSPAYLLALPGLRAGYGQNRLVTGSALAIVVIAIVNLMHFSQGWVQFGYRFSNDFAPFAILLVALGIERVAAAGRGSQRTVAAIAVVIGLIVLSVVINAWGVAWGDALGW
jgi:hypothetical protein